MSEGVLLTLEAAAMSRCGLFAIASLQLNFVFGDFLLLSKVLLIRTLRLLIYLLFFFHRSFLVQKKTRTGGTPEIISAPSP